MSLAELMVSAVVFTTSASCSMQLWSATSQWSQGSERQLQAQLQLDQELLAVEATLQGWAGSQQAGEPLNSDCSSATQSLLMPGVARPDALQHDPVEVTVRHADQEGRLQVQARAPGQGLSRERQLDPAAYGLCGAVDPPDAPEGARAAEQEGLG